ncbi:MAG: arylamine N-acetyltransferase family protein [Pseudonocardia sp.]
MEIAAQLARIGATRPTAPTSAALIALHRAHTRSVPFEDYDIHTGTAIYLRLLVDAADGRWIADVGNGSEWSTPVPRRPGVHGSVQVHRDGDLWWTSERHRDGRWERGWAWTEQPRELADFADRNRYQQYDPGSDFVGRRLAVLSTPTGRVSLRGGVYTEIDGERRTDRPVAPAEEWALLADRFGIVLERPWAERVPQLTGA